MLECPELQTTHWSSLATRATTMAASAVQSTRLSTLRPGCDHDVG